MADGCSASVSFGKLRALSVGKPNGLRGTVWAALYWVVSLLYTTYVATKRKSLILIIHLFQRCGD